MQRRERLDSDVETHHTVGGRSRRHELLVVCRCLLKFAERVQNGTQ
jgi:hypothetical protein